MISTSSAALRGWDFAPIGAEVAAANPADLAGRFGHMKKGRPLAEPPFLRADASRHPLKADEKLT